MGAGKSTTGQLLARQVGWPHVDLDKRIEEATGLEIPDIFAKTGEPEFRRIEYEQLARIIGEGAETQQSRIVSLGGGTTASLNRASNSGESPDSDPGRGDLEPRL